MVGLAFAELAVEAGDIDLLVEVGLHVLCAPERFAQAVDDGVLDRKSVV